MEDLAALNELLYQRIDFLEWKLKNIQLKVIRAGCADILDIDSLPEDVKATIPGYKDDIGHDMSESTKTVKISMSELRRMVRNSLNEEFKNRKRKL